MKSSGRDKEALARNKRRPAGADTSAPGGAVDGKGRSGRYDDAGLTPADDSDFALFTAFPRAPQRHPRSQAVNEQAWRTPLATNAIRWEKG